MTYAFTSTFLEKANYAKVFESGIVSKENYIDIEDIAEDEFDEFDNLKKGITLHSYKELMDYIEKNLK